MIAASDHPWGVHTNACMHTYSGKCYYCKQGYSSRCEQNMLLGCDHLDGAQAEYVSQYDV